MQSTPCSPSFNLIAHKMIRDATNAYSMGLKIRAVWGYFIMLCLNVELRIYKVECQRNIVYVHVELLWDGGAGGSCSCTCSFFKVVGYNEHADLICFLLVIRRRLGSNSRRFGILSVPPSWAGGWRMTGDGLCGVFILEGVVVVMWPKKLQVKMQILLQAHKSEIWESIRDTGSYPSAYLITLTATQCWSGWLSRYSDLLRAGRSGDRI